MSDLVFVLVTLAAFSLLAVLVGAIDRRLVDDRGDGRDDDRGAQ